MCIGRLASTFIFDRCNSATLCLWFSKLSALNTGRSVGGCSSCSLCSEMQDALPWGILEQLCLSHDVLSSQGLLTRHNEGTAKF